MALAFLVVTLSTNVYVDGFNLYYGSVRNTPFKWLDIGKLCATLLPKSQINRIRYFTARVDALPHNQQAPDRQDIYLRALRTIANLTIEEGHFSRWPRLMPQYPLAYIKRGEPPLNVQVQKTEEKGSDVNLATYLLLDCFEKDFDEAVVISNDSDLALPIEIVATRFKKPVHIINPHRRRRLSGKLIRRATSYMGTINKKVLADCQFPPTLTDSRGTFTKPATW